MAGGGSGGGGSGGDGYVEDSGLDCTVPALPAAGSLPNIDKLPDPFLKLDGTRVSEESEWRCRRKEIRAMSERYVYGTKPGKPETVSGSVSSTQITVNVSHLGKSVTFSASVALPPGGQAPYPAIFAVGGFAGDTDVIRSEGVAIINFNATAVGAETGGSDAQRQNKTGAFYTIYGGSNNPTGVLSAWAWGVSRLIDVIAASDGSIIDKDSLGVTGCSRYGKGALAIGALDERIALTIPFESGSAGVPAYRGIALGELGKNGQPPISLANTYLEQAWFGDVFKPFTTAPKKIPIDTHEIVALIAPRGLLILDNAWIGELTPRYAHLAALGGAEVFEALGASANIAYYSNTANGNHCATRQEYKQPTRDAIRRHLLHDASAAGGAIVPDPEWGTADPSDWIDWETPDLE